MAKNLEQHPFREALRDFGIIGLIIGSLVVGAELLSD